jgi:hypothetical protein
MGRNCFGSLLRTTLLPGAVALSFAFALAGCRNDNNNNEPDPTAGCKPMDAVPRRLWRLSTTQFSNSVRDLLGLPAGPGLATNGGGAQFAFFSSDTLSVDPGLAFSINGAVKTALAAAAPQIPALAACNNGEDESACAQRFAANFGMRAFRRPLDDSEVVNLMNVYGQGRMQDFNTGISLMVQALLQSPSFLFRSEFGGTPSAATGTTTLTPYEVATQLGYTFLNSTPDAPLLAAAANGTLGTEKGVAAQVDRLLKTDAVKQNIDNVVVSWFNVPQLVIKTKDPTLIPAAVTAMVPQGQDVQATLEADILTSTTDFVDDILWQGSGKVTELLTSNKLFVNQRLGALYGLPYSAAGARPDGFAGVLDPQPRAGMITQPGFIWSLSDPATTSIVHRGKEIHDYVVCGNALKPPPPGLLSSPAIIMLLAMLPTELDKANYRLGDAFCASCHQSMDSYGLLLEKLDPIGNHRTMYAAADNDPDPITESVDFSKFPKAAPLYTMITGPVELAQAIVDNHQFTDCAAMMMTSYALGRFAVATVPDPDDATSTVTVNNTCEVGAVRAQFNHSDGKLATLLKQVATAAFVQARAGGSP